MRKTNHLIIGITLWLGACGGGSGNNQLDPPVTPVIPPVTGPTVSVVAQRAFDKLTFIQPVAMMQAPNDPARWYVVEKEGVVKVFDNDPLVSTADTFINITALVSSRANEAGLLGMAFHPDFASNGEVFLSYTRSGAPLTSVISRFRSLDGGATLNISSEEILLTVLQDFQNHNGGNIVFGPDGYLYIGLGDGGSANDPNNRAQTLTTLLGKLLRIDVDNGSPYGIPTDNPFAANSLCTQGFGGAACPEIYALGLRNPWRFSFDTQNGDLWLGDVGQDLFEEIDVISLAGNYGWRFREGASCANPVTGCQTNNLIDPVHVYDHTEGASVTGGFVYRSTVISGLTGRYVFGDAVTGRVWALPENPSNGTAAEELIDTSFVISSFGQSTTGDLFIINYATGTLHLIVEAP